MSTRPIVSELHWATLCEALADELGPALAVTQGEARRTWAELDDRAARFAGVLRAAGIGHGAKVAQFLHNAPEYCETWLGALKERAVPVNVNFRYLDAELHHLLDDAGAEAIVYHAALGDRVAEVLPRLPRLRLALAVDDPGGGPAPPGLPGDRYADALAAAAPASRIERSGDDLVMTYTGGTTGLPKGVMGRAGRSLATLLPTAATVGAGPVTDIPGAVALARRLRDEGRHRVGIPAPPLMHATGLVIGMQSPFVFGGTVALLPGRGFDPVDTWSVAEASRATHIAIVGDPFARPMLRALDEHPGRWDLAALEVVASSGAMFSAEVKEGLLGHLPHLVIHDYISSTEGGMGLSVARHGNVPPTGRFRPAPGVTVFTEDDRPVEPGSGDTGRIALRHGVPDGYHRDPDRSARTFREVGGIRYAFPGDWATVEVDGSLSLVGRGSNCINTGGEKVFPEEVEEAAKRHPAVEDCLVLGLPDERFGQRVAAVASARAGAPVTADDILALLRTSLAGYKVPRTLVLVDTVPRTASGKADYAAARQRLTEAPGA